MEKTASVRLLQLLGWEGEALTAFLPEWERAIPLLNLTEADIAFAADVWIPKYWDISLKSVRKMIALFFKEAAELAKIKEYHTNTYPAQGSWMDQFLPKENKGTYLDSKFQEELKVLLGDLYEPLMELRQTVKDGSYIQARMPYDVRMK